jgi:hypothetical protein
VKIYFNKSLTIRMVDGTSLKKIWEARPLPYATCQIP